MCSTNMGQSIRTDIGLMWLKFHTEKVILGSKIKILMQQKDGSKFRLIIIHLEPLITLIEVFLGKTA